MSALVTDHTNIKCVNRLICSSSRVYDKMKKVEKKTNVGNGVTALLIQRCALLCVVCIVHEA